MAVALDVRRANAEAAQQAQARVLLVEGQPGSCECLVLLTELFGMCLVAAVKLAGGRRAGGRRQRHA